MSLAVCILLINQSALVAPELTVSLQGNNAAPSKVVEDRLKAHGISFLKLPDTSGNRFHQVKLYAEIYSDKEDSKSEALFKKYPYEVSVVASVTSFPAHFEGAGPGTRKTFNPFRDIRYSGSGYARNYKQAVEMVSEDVERFCDDWVHRNEKFR